MYKRQGSYFGELALLGERIRSATVQAVAFCELERLDYDDFDELLQAHDDLLAQVIKSAKVRIANLRASFKMKRKAIDEADNEDGLLGASAPKNFWREAAKTALDKSNVFKAVSNAARIAEEAPAAGGMGRKMPAR